MNPRRNRRRGVILIICLWLLAALSLLVLGLGYRLSLEGRIMHYRLCRREMVELARGAVTLAAARIERADPDFVFHGQAWARPEVLSKADFGGLGPEALERYRVEVMAFDELSKLNINTATRRQLTGLGVIDDELAGAVLDWRDGDDIRCELGAESRYYGSLKPPISCKSAPFESTWELLVVRGVTGDLFNGPEREVMIPLDEPEWLYQREGLHNLVTCYGTGLVNLNTAPAEVLLAVPGFDAAMVEGIIYHRRGPDGIERTGDDVCFKNFDELAEIDAFTEFAIAQAGIHCTLTSDVFSVRVRVTDRRSSARLYLEVDVKRSQDGLETVFWRER